jgi:hypothetical protein
MAGLLNQSKSNPSSQKIFTVGIHQESPLDIDFGIKNERQDFKTGTVSTCGWRG